MKKLPALSLWQATGLLQKCDKTPRKRARQGLGRSPVGLYWYGNWRGMVCRRIAYQLV